jgi:hypothetical protein
VPPSLQTAAAFDATSFGFATDPAKTAIPVPPSSFTPPPIAPQHITPQTITPAPAAPVAPKPPLFPPGSKKPLWLATAAVAAFVIVVSLVYSLVHNKFGGQKTTSAANGLAAFVKVTLTASQPGATFKVDGQPVSTPLTLKPGDHIGEADLNGYSPDIHSFNVPAGADAPPVSVRFALRPALPELLFNSGIVTGSLIFDDAPPVDLQQGGFTKSDIPAGEHHVRVMDGTREVLSFSFNAAPKQIIKLTSPLSTRTAAGIIVSSLGGAAQLYGTSGMKASLAGQPLQAIPAEGLAIPAANPPRTFTVSDGTKPRDMTPDASAQPLLSVFLSGGVERVPVTVTANVPEAAITVDGDQISRRMANGNVRFSLPAGSYSINVVADGYQPATPQRLAIKEGDSPKSLEFQLTAVVRLANLSLTGAPPDSLVFLDDVRVGTVNAAGFFSKDVNPASHTVTIRKAGLEDFKQTHDFKASENFQLAVQMHAAAGSLTFHITPANAKISLRHDSETIAALNGQTVNLAPGSYVVTVTADEFRPQTETVVVEAGKTLPFDLLLQPVSRTAEVASGPNIPFANAKSWTVAGPWQTHTGAGVSLFTGGMGSHTIDILKRKKTFGGTRHIVFLADYTGIGNYIQYTLDGHNLLKVVYVNNQPSAKIPLHFGPENGEEIRMIVELTPNSFIIKNGAGTVVDTLYKTNIGGFAFVDDVTLRITP